MGAVFRMSVSEEVEGGDVLEVVVRSDSVNLLDHVHVDVRRSASTSDVEPSPNSKKRKRNKEMADRHKSIQASPKIVQNGKPKDGTHLSTFLCNNPTATKALMSVFIQKKDPELPVSLTWMFSVDGTGSRIVRYCIESEISQINDHALLMREENAYVRVISAYFQVEGYYFIKNVVGKVLQKITKYNSLEIDPNKVATPEELESNRTSLRKACKDMMDVFFKGASHVSVTLREALILAYTSAKAKFSDSSYKIMGSCLFLRFVVPNMVQPEQFGLVKNMTPVIRRNIILCSKVLQLIANEVEPTDKEQYMVDANLIPFIVTNIRKLHKFYD